MIVLRDHLIVMLIVLPLVTGAVLLLVDERRHALKGVIGVTATLLLVAGAITLLRLVDQPATIAYRLGAWPAPFGIVLVGDRLSALMVLLVGVLALAALLFALARWHRAGPRFHALVQFLLMGLNGAFLTGDLFNLFVFVEVLLAASYGLALHGSGVARVSASLHYITVNLSASLLFLIGASLLYGVTGTLNLADLAVHARNLSAADRGLFDTGAAMLGVVFLVKAAMWPLGFWLPPSYAAAAAPAAALFAILTKVGVYALLRVWLLLFGANSSASFGEHVLVVGGILTLAYANIGVLASRDLGRLAGFSLLVSVGTLLAAVGGSSTALTAAALYYLVVSTLGIAAFFLLIELIERARDPVTNMLAVTAEAFGIEEDDEPKPEQERGIAIPATAALLGLAFICCALLVAGLPPLPGFVAKFALFAALLDAATVPTSGWVFIALLTSSGIVALIALSRVGIGAFWAAADKISAARVRVIEFVPIALLLLACAALAVAADPAMRYLNDTAQTLHAPQSYVRTVLSPS